MHKKIAHRPLAMLLAGILCVPGIYAMPVGAQAEPLPPPEVMEEPTLGTTADGVAEDWAYSIDVDGNAVLYRYMGGQETVTVPASLTINDTGYPTILKGSGGWVEVDGTSSDRTFPDSHYDKISFEAGVKAAGDVTHLFSGFSADRLDLTGIDTSETENMTEMFTSLTVDEIDVSPLDTSHVTDMTRMFNLSYGNVGSIKGLDKLDTKNVKEMDGMFAGCSKVKDLDLSAFDTSNVTTMNAMFDGCSSIEGLDLSSFDTSKVKDMWAMFRSCGSLEDLDVTSFDTSRVTDMGRMFEYCDKLDGVDLSKFSTGSVTSMYAMFDGCKALRSIDVSSFDTSKVADLTYMFCNCSSLKGLDVSNFDTGKLDSSANSVFSGCTDLETLELGGFLASGKATWPVGLFENCSSLKGLDVGNMDLSYATSLYRMFAGCEKLASIDLSAWKGKTAKVESTNGMFSGCSSLAEVSMDGASFSAVTDLSTMFKGCSKLEDPGVGGLNVSKARYLAEMFCDCASLKEIDLSSWTCPEARSFDSMFRGCGKLGKVTFGSGFETPKLENVSYMFADCPSLESLDVTGFDTQSLKYASGFTSGCSGLTSLKMGQFNVSGVSDISKMFYGCSALTTLDVSSFDTAEVDYMGELFSGCTKISTLDLSGFDMTDLDSANDMLKGMSSLTTLYTPINIPEGKSISLPGTYLDDDGNSYSQLPVQSESIRLIRKGSGDTEGSGDGTGTDGADTGTDPGTGTDGGTGEGRGDVVKVESFTVNAILIEGTVGFTGTLKEGTGEDCDYAILPSDATDKKVVWTSSDPDIVEVDDSGVMVFKSVGSAVLTGETRDGGFTGTIDVTVVDPHYYPDGGNGTDGDGDSGDSGDSREDGATDQADGTGDKDPGKEDAGDKDNTTGTTDNMDSTGTAGNSGDTDAGATGSQAVESDVTEIVLDATELAMLVGETGKLAYSFGPAGETGQVVWTSPDASIVAVSQDGTIKAEGCGTVEVTAALAGNAGVTASCKVAVYAAGDQLATGDGDAAVVYTAMADSSGCLAACFKSHTDKKAKSVEIPDTVNVNGCTVDVIEIGAEALAKHKRLKSAEIGRNVEKIGENAFKNCKKLKTVDIASELLTEDGVAGNVFKGIRSGCKIVVPEDTYPAYKKWMKRKGQKKVRVKIG